MVQQRDLEKKEIKDISGVEDVSYESKAQAIENFKKQLGDKNKGLVDGLEKDNPIPNSYIVRFKSQK